MTDRIQRLIEAAKAVLPYLKASTDRYNELKAVDAMSRKEADAWLRKSLEQPDETPAQKLRREADEMEAKDADIKRFREAIAACNE